MTREVTLPEELRDVVAFGGVKEMSCDSNGNIFAPTNRKYGDAVNMVLRVAPDAKSVVRYTIDNLPVVRNGDIVDFAVEDGGNIHLLVRQVLEYSKLEVPLKIGKFFAVCYRSDGQILAQTQLNVDKDAFEPTGMAILRDGARLVVGRRFRNGLLHVVAQTIGKDGASMALLNLGSSGTKPSHDRTAGSPRVFHPAAIKAKGLIYVLRGSSAEPVYVLSELGQLLKTISLNGPYFEFDSPHISDDLLIVHKHATAESEDSPSAPAQYLVYDLRTGEKAEALLRAQGAALACYRRDALTFMGQPSIFSERWAIVFTGR